jgi:vacuolar-type H+-ATPase subunit H
MCKKCEAAQKEYDKIVDSAYEIFRNRRNQARKEMDNILNDCEKKYEI